MPTEAIRRWRRAFTGTLAGLALVLLAADARADVKVDAPAEADAAALQACPAVTGLEVRAREPADALMACDGAGRALAFLARAGLEPPARTRIVIVEQLPGELKDKAVGCYLRDSRDILLLSFASFQAGGQWFRLPADAELYRSAAAHEMAHAVVGCQGGPARLPVAAHEYVAYVVLFATMEPSLRARLLAKFPGRGFTSTLQINDLNHIAQPNQFGVDAWRHFLRRRDRDAWLREVIAGQIVQEVFGDGP